MQGSQEIRALAVGKVRTHQLNEPDPFFQLIMTLKTVRVLDFVFLLTAFYKSADSKRKHIKYSKKK